jgi:hypothetical protein
MLDARPSRPSRRPNAIQAELQAPMRPRGTEGSNPVPSSGESANPRSLAHPDGVMAHTSGRATGRDNQSARSGAAGSGRNVPDGEWLPRRGRAAIYRDTGHLADADKAFSEALTIYRETSRRVPQLPHRVPHVTLSRPGPLSPLTHPPQQRGSIVGCRLTGKDQPRARDSVSQP